jgi:hypothetical protein
MSHERESIALMLVADGKGILAADETVPTLTRRFDTLGIRGSRHGMGRTRTWRPAGGPFPTGPAPTPRRVSGGIRMRWKRHRATPMIHRIAETGATTDTTDRRQRNGRFDDTGFRGGKDGKRAG